MVKHLTADERKFKLFSSVDNKIKVSCNSKFYTALKDNLYGIMGIHEVNLCEGNYSAIVSFASFYNADKVIAYIKEVMIDNGFEFVD